MDLSAQPSQFATMFCFVFFLADHVIPVVSFLEGSVQGEHPGWVKWSETNMASLNLIL